MIDDRTDREVEADAAQAEHDAVTAEQAIERAAEQAHDDTVTRLVEALRDLGDAARDSARHTLGRMLSEVELRLSPNAHRVELLAQHQHLARLAPLVAEALDDTRPYGLVETTERVIAGHRIVHLTTGGGDLLDRALDRAVDRVLATVRAEQPARDAEHEAASDDRASGAL